jgi:hypothetical protein
VVTVGVTSTALHRLLCGGAVALHVDGLFARASVCADAQVFAALCVVRQFVV